MIDDSTAMSATQPEKWVFYLYNVKFLAGDFARTDEYGNQISDSIDFVLADRTWRLTDALLNQRKQMSKEDLAKPLLSGVLTTPYSAGDSKETMAQLMEDLGCVLSIAMSRTISWQFYSLLDQNNERIDSDVRRPWVKGFNQKRFEPITNWVTGSLKHLIEGSLPIIANDREWFRRTLDLLLQAQLPDYYEVRCHLLYTLVDRISTYAVVSTGEPEIDPELKTRARKPEFIKKAHSLLQELSPENWTAEHTNNVLGEIKRWNTMPSFVAKIQRACSLLGLTVPEKELLRPRNVLLHDGELNVEEGENYEHYLELDRVVLTMIFRLLGYEGEYYHPKSGDTPVPILAEQPTE